MQETANLVVEKAVNLAEESGLFENPGVLFGQNVEKEFSMLRPGNGVKIFDINEEIDDGVFVYAANPWKIVVAKSGSSKSKIISDDDLIELLALSYVARGMARLNKPHEEELRSVNKKMHDIVTKYM